MLIGLCGKTNSGKTTMFSALTLVPAEISNRTFTTIKPNIGTGFVRKKCACLILDKRCGNCKDGTRHMPVKIIDVAGLVPEAHKGKGMGNQFLSDMMMADGIIHVIDVSGSTDKNGNLCAPGTHDPQEDIEWVEDELIYWMGSLLQKIDKKKLDAKVEHIEDSLTKQFTGLGITKKQIAETISKIKLNISSEESCLEFCRHLLEKSKPIIVAANKIDVIGADKIYERVKNDNIVPCYADGELALRRAAEKGIIEYYGNNFTIKNATEQQKRAFEKIKSIIERCGSTGVQQCLEKLVFEKMQMIVVYPVENEHKLSDKTGRILPDAFLMKKGSTAMDLAFRVHENIGKKFIAAVDARSGRRVSADHELKDGDIISIKAGR